MARITFITAYNDFSIGVNVLSSLLEEDGHEISVIFCKLPTKKKIPWFTTDAKQYMEFVDTFGEIYCSHPGSNPASEQETAILLELLGRLQPDLIGFSLRTQDTLLAQLIIPAIRQKMDVPLLAGGFGPSLNPEVFAPLVDYVFIGEAEGCIKDLVNKLVAGESVKGFSNLAYLDQGELRRNPLSAPGSMAFKQQSLIKETYIIENDRLYNYTDRAAIVKTNAYSTFMGRGCIMTCSYCSVGNWGALYEDEGFRIKKRRNRPVEEVIGELIKAKELGFTFVHFRDEFLTTSREELKRFFRLYEKEVGLPFWAYLVPKQVLSDPEILDLAVDAGFVDTELGFQSGSDRINREIFTRYLSHEQTLKYAWMLDERHVNAKYDFIIFNPAETPQDHEAAFSLLQALPNKRSYLFMPRLFYYANTPIGDMLAPFNEQSLNADYYYRMALMYLICFAVPKEEFAQVRINPKLIGSWQALKQYYQEYLHNTGYRMPIGTHDIPDSITTHRYKRILQKQGFSEVAIWGGGSYYQDLKEIFDGVKIRVHVDDPGDGPVGLTGFDDIHDPVPLFVCRPGKHEVKARIRHEWPHYPGPIIV
ncbi:MAG: cobalamin-dependent protein [Magnetococcus sp. YQC-5]